MIEMGPTWLAHGNALGLPTRFRRSRSNRLSVGRIPKIWRMLGLAPWNGGVADRLETVGHIL